MKKVISLTMTCLIVVSILAVFAPQACANTTLPIPPSGWIRLTTNPYGDNCPGYSPDRSKIAYHAYRSDRWNNDIWVITPMDPIKHN